MNTSKKNLLRWARLLTTYLFGQGGVQLLQLATGFLLINWLSKDNYASFTLVIAIQSATAVLVEMGVTQPLTALLGKRVDEPALAGRYIGASRYYRDRLLLAGAVLLIPVFYLSADKAGWTPLQTALFWLWTVLTLTFRSWSGIYSCIVLLQQRLKANYALTLTSGGFRLLAIIAAHLLGFLSAQWAICFGAMQAAISGAGYRWITRKQVAHPGDHRTLQGEKREILQLALPRAPSLVYFSLEGQIAIFLIAMFGSTSGIAEIGALSRLGMLLLLFNKAAHVLVNPYFAKLDSPRVAPMAGRLAVLSLGLFALISGTSWFFPGLFLWVLGDGYQHLEFAVFLMMATSALHLVTRMLFTVVLARKYIFKWFPLADILPDILTLILCIAVYDLSTISGVLYLGLTVAVVKLIVKTAMLIHGLRWESRTASAAS
ncbi:MAG: hypothetical protein ACOC4K_01960 [Verrucomicrobiota bacterium]